MRYLSGSCGEQAFEQGNESDAYKGNTAARHQLLHALRLCAGVVIAVTFQKVNNSPDAKTGSEGDNEGLKYVYC